MSGLEQFGLFVVAWAGFLLAVWLGWRIERRRSWQRHVHEALAVGNDHSRPPAVRDIWCELIPYQGKWRWMLWDDGGLKGTEQVDGMLVPYVMGCEITRNDARRAAHDAVLYELDFPAKLSRFEDGAFR